jgi:DNA polymerase III epsilon subunit-like protein
MNFPNRVVAFDCETLGLNAMYDALTSVAAVVFEDGEPTGDHFVRVVAPDYTKLKVSMEALNVQGRMFTATGELDREALIAAVERIFPEGAPSSKQVMSELTEWARGVGAWDLPNVAHHASFDLGFYDAKLSCNTTVFRKALSPIWICTKKMAMAAELKGSKKFGLQETAMLLEIPFEPLATHNAQYDAELCGRVYFGLKAHLEAPVLAVAR